MPLKHSFVSGSEIGRLMSEAATKISRLRDINDELLSSLKALLNDPNSAEAFNQAVEAVRKAEKR